MKRRLAGMWLAAFMIIFMLGCDRSGAPPATVAPAASPSLTVARPKRASLPRIIEQPGAVFADEETPLFAKLAGFVSHVNVDIGDSVAGPSWFHEGTILAELSIPELEDEAREKQAMVAKAEAEVQQAISLRTVAEANVAAAEARVGVAQAGLKGAQAAFERWDLESRRVAELVRGGVIDPQQGDETQRQAVTADAARDEASARVTAAEKAVLMARAEFEKAKADVKAAEAKLAVAQAEAARARTMLDYRFIRAPFDGVVTRRKADTGHFVQPLGGARGEALFTVARLNTVRVVVRVPESDAALIRKGEVARVFVPALKAEFDGRVARTAEALEPESRTLRTEIDLPNTDGRLRPGLFAQTRITVEMPEAWVVPASAVVKQAEVTVCFLLRDGKAVRVPVQSGRTDGTLTEVFRKQVPGSPGAWEEWSGTEEVLAGQTNTLTDGQPVETKRAP